MKKQPIKRRHQGRGSARQWDIYCTHVRRKKMGFGRKKSCLRTAASPCTINCARRKSFVYDRAIITVLVKYRISHNIVCTYIILL